MTLTLQTIEALAPDQASLSAAKKLLSDKKWAGQGKSETTTTAWGECQGSGSKPYYVVIDVADHGYKCTCPSRKFPCKHALALMWRFVENADNFGDSPAPTWVSDWLSRRKKSTKPIPANSDNAANDKSIDAIIEEPILDAEELAKKQAAAQKRAEKTKASTDQSIGMGLLELQGWLNDQLSGGVGAFLDDVSSRTQQISQRLVDAKAGNLASYVDELAAVILDTASHQRADVALFELGRLHLLTMAWQSTPDDIDVRQAIHNAINKDGVLQNPDTLRVQGVWQVMGEQTISKKDGLISQATYLVRLQDGQTSPDTPNIALLLDYYHPYSGIKKSVSQLGAYMVGELCYYPSKKPLRAFFSQVQTISATTDDIYVDDTTLTDGLTSEQFKSWSHLASQDDLIQSYAKHLLALPWVSVMPYLLGRGQIKQDDAKRYWYCGEQDILLSNKNIPKIAQAGQLNCALILWRGHAGELLSVVSEQWGVLAC